MHTGLGKRKRDWLGSSKVQTEEIGQDWQMVVAWDVLALFPTGEEREKGNASAGAIGGVHREVDLLPVWIRRDYQLLEWLGWSHSGRVGTG